MLRRCSNCAHCSFDWKALQIGIYIHECRKTKRLMQFPFWNGWRCKRWEKDYGK